MKQSQIKGELKSVLLINVNDHPKTTRTFSLDKTLQPRIRAKPLTFSTLLTGTNLDLAKLIFN